MAEVTRYMLFMCGSGQIYPVYDLPSFINILLIASGTKRKSLNSVTGHVNNLKTP